MVRWEELAASLPPTVLSRLSGAFPSVEAFLVSCSKSSGVTQGAHGQGAAMPPASVPAACGVDTSLLVAVEGLVGGLLAPQWSTGLQLLQRLQSDPGVLFTGCSNIDELLGGGLRPGIVVEVAGETASGKTQLCLQAAAAAVLQGHVVLYVDTTGSFKLDRVVAMAEGLVRDRHPAAAAAAAAAAAGAAHGHGLDPASLAQQLGSCIHVQRPTNVFELLTFLDRLDASLQAQQQQQAAAAPGAGGYGDGGESTTWQAAGPRLLVVDSVSALLSTLLGNTQHTQGTTLLTAVGRTLKHVAAQHSVAVLVTNHVTSVRGGLAGEADRGATAAAGVGGLKPALGEQWRPQAHMRIQLSVDDSQPGTSGARVATLTASPVLACGHQAFLHIHMSGLT
ncbi:hypothetical protein HYH02_006881 [Chlamydomonas schloesseri]|uniref:RecA family profile 1 domain-containing protein n=1 Tax=Chlamydomonas schloesseri TaxID=2026947 RepID=A0A836B5N0_9CHLO|nr:hypothetical protein HYH02_006881 [Chlamydomonas schloesseri]|eukprot:KAG2448297.1 hypothetical protein HYH02_006881 [Chlamydomonas schloesseri]